MSRIKKHIICITGPTAVGKTAYTLHIAKALQAEIISCDSRQMYQEMNIGTAKPTKKELAEVPHHFVDNRSIHEPYTAVEYAKEVELLIPQLFEKNDTVIFTGGTGLYMQAALEGLGRVPKVPERITNALERQLTEKGISKLQNKLKKLDPEYYVKVDVQNTRRLIRALSVIEATGKKYSEFLGHNPKNKYPTKYYILDRPREDLYTRINNRVDQMIDQGLVEEAKTLYPFKKIKALQTVGYQELFKHFDGDWSLAFAIDKIKQHSRNYAKRQLTWFRRLNNSHWVDVAKISKEAFTKRIIDEHMA